MSRPLPPKPHIDVLKKQARQLLNDHKSGHPEAVARVQAVIADLPPAATEVLTLRNAQQVIAREYEFTSWQALADQVGGEDSPAAAIPSFYHTLAADLVTSRLEGHLPSFGRLGEEFERRMGAIPSTASGDGSDPALEQARLAVAAQSGCDSLEALKVAETQQAGLVNAEQIDGFERLHAEFARLIGSRFAALEGVKKPVEAELAYIDRTSYGEYVFSMARPSWAFLCSMDNLDGDLILDLGPKLADALVAPEQEDREAQLGRIVEGLFSDLEQVWMPVTRLRSSQIVPHSDPFDMMVAPMYETSVLIAFTMPATAATEELPGVARICYPASSIAGVLDAVMAHEPVQR